MKTLLLELDESIYAQVINFLKILPKQQCHIIESPQEINSDRAEHETAYLLNSDTMKQRLLTAKGRDAGIELEEVCERLGI